MTKWQGCRKLSPIHFWKESATDGTYRSKYWWNQGLAALIQGQIYNPEWMQQGRGRSIFFVGNVGLKRVWIFPFWLRFFWCYSTSCRKCGLHSGTVYSDYGPLCYDQHIPNYYIIVPLRNRGIKALWREAMGKGEGWKTKWTGESWLIYTSRQILCAFDIYI